MACRALATACLVAAVTTTLSAQGTRLLRQPTLSATQVAVTYGSDLWIADRAGGQARRLTSTAAVESDTAPAKSTLLNLMIGTSWGSESDRALSSAKLDAVSR